MNADDMFQRFLEIVGRLMIGLGASALAIACIVAIAGIGISHHRYKQYAQPRCRKALVRRNQFIFMALVSALCLYFFVRFLY